MGFKIRRKQIDSAIDYKDTFRTQAGKKVIADLATHTGVLTNSFDSDPYEHAFRAGRRDTFLYIIHKLNIDIEELERRLQEAAEQNTYE